MPSSTRWASPPSPPSPPSLPSHTPTTLGSARWPGGAQRLLLRPVLPQDDGLLAALVLAQSAGARRNRFHGAVKASARLGQQMSQVDTTHQLALVVSTLVHGAEQLVADARYSIAADGQSAEFALLVDERWQRQGVGAWGLRALQQAAAGAGLTWLEGEVLQGNQAMLGLARHCGFVCCPDPQDERLVRVQRRLLAVDAAATAADTGSTADACINTRPHGLLQRLGRALTGRPRGLWCMPQAR